MTNYVRVGVGALARLASWRFIPVLALSMLPGLALAEAGPPDRPPDPGESSCSYCHRDHLEPFGASVHAAEGVNCTDCHGGDSTRYDEESAMYDVDSFVGAPDRRDIPALCAGCHSDPRRMHAYGLRTDQLALYRLSVHGERLFLHGDEHTAVCTDCHESHRIVDTRAAGSPVAPARIADTCAHCHADAELMAPYGLDAGIPEAWRQGIHGQALLEHGDTGAPNCATCHGNHAAAPPGVQEVGLVCGQCHLNTRQHFDESPHAGAAAAGHFEQCVSCHGNHRVEPASTTLLTATCSNQGCHAADSVEAGLGYELLGVLEHTDRLLAEARAKVAWARRKGLAADEEAVLLEDARTYAVAAVPVLHTLSREKLEQVSARSTGLSEDIIERVDRMKRHAEVRRLALIPVWLWVLALVSLLLIKRRRLHQALHAQWEAARRQTAQGDGGAK